MTDRIAVRPAAAVLARARALMEMGGAARPAQWGSEVAVDRPLRELIPALHDAAKDAGQITLFVYLTRHHERLDVDVDWTRRKTAQAVLVDLLSARAGHRFAELLASVRLQTPQSQDAGRVIAECVVPAAVRSAGLTLSPGFKIHPPAQTGFLQMGGGGSVVYWRGAFPRGQTLYDDLHATLGKARGELAAALSSRAVIEEFVERFGGGATTPVRSVAGLFAALMSGAGAAPRRSGPGTLPPVEQIVTSKDRLRLVVEHRALQSGLDPLDRRLVKIHEADIERLLLASPWSVGPRRLVSSLFGIHERDIERVIRARGVDPSYVTLYEGVRAAHRIHHMGVIHVEEAAAGNANEARGRAMLALGEALFERVAAYAEDLRIQARMDDELGKVAPSDAIDDLVGALHDLDTSHSRAQLDAIVDDMLAAVAAVDEVERV